MQKCTLTEQMLRSAYWFKVVHHGYNNVNSETYMYMCLATFKTIEYKKLINCGRFLCVQYDQISDSSVLDSKLAKFILFKLRQAEK